MSNQQQTLHARIHRAQNTKQREMEHPKPHRREEIWFSTSSEEEEEEEDTENAENNQNKHHEITRKRLRRERPVTAIDNNKQQKITPKKDTHNKHIAQKVLNTKKDTLQTRSQKTPRSSAAKNRFQFLTPFNDLRTQSESARRAQGRSMTPSEARPNHQMFMTPAPNSKGRSHRSTDRTTNGASMFSSGTMSSNSHSLAPHRPPIRTFGEPKPVSAGDSQYGSLFDSLNLPSSSIDLCYSPQIPRSYQPIQPSLPIKHISISPVIRPRSAFRDEVRDESSEEGSPILASMRNESETELYLNDLFLLSTCTAAEAKPLILSRQRQYPTNAPSSSHLFSGENKSTTEAEVTSDWFFPSQSPDNSRTSNTNRSVMHSKNKPGSTIRTTRRRDKFANDDPLGEDCGFVMASQFIPALHDDLEDASSQGKQRESHPLMSETYRHQNLQDDLQDFDEDFESMYEQIDLFDLTYTDQVKRNQPTSAVHSDAQQSRSAMDANNDAASTDDFDIFQDIFEMTQYQATPAPPKIIPRPLPASPPQTQDPFLPVIHFPPPPPKSPCFPRTPMNTITSEAFVTNVKPRSVPSGLLGYIPSTAFIKPAVPLQTQTIQEYLQHPIFPTTAIIQETGEGPLPTATSEGQIIFVGRVIAGQQVLLQKARGVNSFGDLFLICWKWEVVAEPQIEP